MFPLDVSARPSIAAEPRPGPAHGARLVDHMVLLFLPLFTASATAGQGVRGQVVEEQSSRPLAGVEVRLHDDSGGHVARTLSNAEGQFWLEVERPGRYTLSAQSFGYQTRRVDEIDVDGTGLRRLTVVLEPRPIPLEGVRGRANRPGEHHEMSYAGLYMRHRESPSIGSNRVILRTDPEFRVIATVRDLLYNFRPAGIGCGPFVFWNGFYRGWARPDSVQADEYLDISSNMVEGIEYYRDLTSIPLSIRSEPAIVGQPISTIRRCGVLLIWPRRSA